MPSGSMSAVILHLRKAICGQGEAGLTDAQLLERFIEHRDEVAFAALVARHGSMVMGVCLRVSRDHQDAEDAFQATFLVLARRAASISSRELLANWLYGVAHKTSLKARASSAKRRAKEIQVTEMPDSAAADRENWNESIPTLLDQELNRLPEKYRIPIILCDLEGKTRKEAAQQLGCPEGSLSSRLSRARAMLAKRLVRHGLAVSSGPLVAVLSEQAASAGVPSSVASATIKAATLSAAKQATEGIVSANVASLVQGVLRTMVLSKLKIGTAWLLVGLIAFGACSLIYRTAMAQPATLQRNDATPAASPPKKTAKEDPQPDDAIAKDLDALQGRWSVVSMTFDLEHQPPAEVVQAVVVVFRGRSMTYDPGLSIDATDPGKIRYHVDPEPDEMQFTLAPNSNPKAIRFTAVEPDNKVRTVNAIYKFNEDSLTLCFGEVDGPSPVEFTAKKGSKQALLVLQRLPQRKLDTPKKELGKVDEKAVQGTWKIVAAERYGRTWKNVDGEFVDQDKTPIAFPISLQNPHQVVFSGDQCTLRFFKGPGQTLVLRETFALEAGRMPKWITLTGKDGSLTYGIYALEGNEMRLCWQMGQRQDSRPSNFTTRKELDRDDDPEVWVLKRQSTTSDEIVEAPKETLKPVPIKQSWDGIIQNRNLLKQSPAEGFLLDAKAWEKMWKAWRPGEKLPAVDFEKEIAIILTVPGPNRISSPDLVVNKDGNVRVPLPTSTLLPDDGRIGYKILIIDRSGVNSINGGRSITRNPPSY